MTETNLAAVGNGAGNAEGLQTLADGGSGVGSLAAVLLDGDGGADGVSPLGVLKADGLDVLNHVINVKTCILGDLLGFLNGADAVFGELSENLFFSSVV